MARSGRPRVSEKATTSSLGDEVKKDLATPSHESPQPPTPLQGAQLDQALYEYCCAQPPGTAFSQDALLKSSLVHNDELPVLLASTQRLTADKRFRLMATGAKEVHFRCRQPNVAKLLMGLDPDSNLVYEYVETAGRDGTWTQNIMKRSKLHKGIMDKSLKTLEQKRLIKPITDHRFPSRRTFMIIGLQPHETVTGGPFYNEGELDDEFVHHLTGYIEHWVVLRSWAFPPKEDTKSSGKKRKFGSGAPANTEQAESLRAATLDRHAEDHDQQIKPFPGGYTKYPTIGQITNALNDSGIAKTKLRIADVTTLVDVLVWDGIFECIGNSNVEDAESISYRAIHKQATEDARSASSQPTALTEAPCGRCPVFDFCEEGGLVNAATCPYFQEWLNF